MAYQISIVIVTFYRDEMLRRTVVSCLLQRDIDPSAVEIIVVDGSAEASGRAVVDALSEEAIRAGIGLRLVHEPRPGISHSRNKGVSEAIGPLVAFIDDDEEADPYWLSRMLDCQRRHNADVVVGPVFPRFEDEACSSDPFWEWYFTYDSRLASGTVAVRGGGTHNCLFVKETCCPTNEPFDPAFGLTGGEDSRFFMGVAQRGGRVVWSADSVIYEFIPAARTTWSYAIRRRLRENQLLLQSFLWSDPPDVRGVAKWMVIGLGQVIVFAPFAVLLYAFHRPTAKKCFAKAVGGLGKLLWMPGLTLIGYGQHKEISTVAEP